MLPTASKICEYLEDWVAAICDDPNSSDLLDQFDAAEEIKFTDLKRLDSNILPCHEKAIYFSRPLEPIINNMESF
ncbi:kinase-like domain-containing protein [Rhizophagus clarus]|uniref:Kinase-like domain-containing protein n=1 Tax=Rhizophagus clarus TaxID=94130 RepID=A0A8H3QY25_9GLOM|nr:kinase-like domain-containing protein [Rhizophagus clarus]